jgi:hypothetical protein
MKSAIRAVLVPGLALLFAFPAATALAGDSKDLEATPQVKIYRASLEAIEAGDYEAYKKCMTSEAVAEIEKQTKELGKTPKDGMELLKLMAPTEVKFTNLEVDGKKAVLTAVGKAMDDTQYGSIDLLEEKGEWRVGRQSWTNKKPGT